MIEAVQGQVPLSVLLGQHRAAELSIDDKHSHHDHDEDHDHDAFDSLHLDLGAVDRERLMQALQSIVEQHGVLRVKGFAALPGKKMRLLVQGVGRRFDAYFDRAWAEGEAAATRLVFIGKQLDAAVLQRTLKSAEV
jgi:cobalamin biosynthesis protein CobW